MAKWTTAIAALMMSTPSAASVAAPTPPAALASYIDNGRFNPGDYHWMRGYLADARPADKAAAQAITTWVDACFAEGQAQTRTELRELGIANPTLAQSAFRDALCASVASRPDARQFSSFAELAKAAAEAKPVADAFLFGVGMAEGMAGPRGPSLADRLLARPLGEQMLRMALGWGEGQMTEAPPLSPAAKEVLRARLSAALSERDRTNTQWLKGIIAEHGWPKVSAVGDAAAAQAWLLVQHADADPAFQLRVLRLMEPLLASREVSKRDYAYLYDRVMLKISGKQRYATQATCRAGKRVTQPLEDEARVAALRGEAGLEPLADYFAQMKKLFGDCPADR